MKAFFQEQKHREKENRILKKKILGLLVAGVLVASTLTGCQGVTKSFGGSMTLNLKPKT